MDRVTERGGASPSGRTPWRCRLGLHRWVLWDPVLRQDAGEPAWTCARCGAEPRTP